MFLIRATTVENGLKTMWVAYAKSEANAEHIAGMYRATGHDDVRIRDLEAEDDFIAIPRLDRD